ncbi:unnamed protein product [Phytomonas sp. Hart1]|nr:unnamed protein product [Phytomonas sp. Hart1]|eukprot:CCW70000.1 unnamed protein product [Phytomonas sp. isolate Hart1]
MARKADAKRSRLPVGVQRKGPQLRINALTHLLQAVPVPPEESAGEEAGQALGGKALRSRLAAMGHAMLLLAHVERAQQGAASPQRAAPSVKLSRRWIEAVTYYCGVSVGMDDVAKVAAAFPRWMRVKWGVEEAANGLARSQGLRPRGTNFGEADSHPAASAGGSMEKQCMGGPMPAAEELTARFYILASHVPSIEEASTELQNFLRAKDASESKNWLDKIVQYRALDAYTEQQLEEFPGGPSPSAHTQASLGDIPVQSKKDEKKREAPAPSVDAPDPGRGGTFTVSSPSPCMPPQFLDFAPSEPPHNDHDEDDVALLTMLSPQLKASLSAAKLKEVLRFMKREATNAAAEELSRIEKKQEEERLLNTYAHLRSLFGRGKTELNAARLLERLATESLFEDHPHVLSQLSLLLNRRGSGLSAVTLSQSEDCVVNSPTGGPVAPLRKVDDLDRLTADELENTLVQLDRTKAFLKTS